MEEVIFLSLDKKAVAILEETGVMQSGHFCLTSGRHSDRYMQCARLFEHADKAGLLCGELASLFARDAVDAVVGPAVGAVQMAFEISRHLGCHNLFAEREEGKMRFRRGFALRPNERVLVVEDAVTTGGSVKEVISLCQAQGAQVIGVGAIVDRSGGQVDFGVPLRACLQLSIPSWPPENCPLCRDNIPVTKPGSRVFAP